MSTLWACGQSAPIFQRLANVLAASSAKVERAEFRCAYMRFLVFLGLAVVGTCKRIAIASASAGWPVLLLDCLRESRGQPFGLAACVQFEPFRAIANGAVVFC